MTPCITLSSYQFKGSSNSRRQIDKKRNSSRTIHINHLMEITGERRKMFAVLVCKNKEQHIFRACISCINHSDESCNDNLIIGKGERFFIAELGG